MAVMQPYFYPYPGYFALLASVDTFVIYDCVQFARRGRVHRTELGRSAEGPDWLTLPLARQRRDIAIADLRFAPGATEEFRRRLRKSQLRDVVEQLPSPIIDALTSELTDVVAYLEANLRAVASLLGLVPRIARSSDFGIDPALRGQQRIIAIARKFGADHYVNAPGGRDLYDPKRFAEAGVQLQFLPSYEGRHRFLLPALAEADPAQLRSEVLTIAAGRRNG